MSPSSPIFHYVRSCDLDLPLKVKVCTLEGTLPRPGHEEVLADPGLKYCGRNQARVPDLLVTAVVASRGRLLHVPVQTKYKHFKVRLEWNEWLEFPLRYSDLPDDACLCLTLWDTQGPGQRHPVGGTTVRLFDPDGGVFVRGQNDLLVWPNSEADPGTDTLTPGKKSRSSEMTEKDSLERLQKLAKDHREDRLPHVDWLDRLTVAEVERIYQREKQGSETMFLMVEFQELKKGENVTCEMVYYEKNGDLKNVLSSRSEVIRAPDFDVLRDNLVEAKHHRLARSLRAGQSDRDLKPNAETRNRLNDIIGCSKGLSLEEEDLIWRYRFYLSNNKKALSKFVKCVNWRAKQESSQALELLAKWSPMDPEDALELLGPDFRHPGVRRYAVQRLRQAPDADLQLYLLQLVQALKYEKFSDLQPGNKANVAHATSSVNAGNLNCEEGKFNHTVKLPGLANFLIERALENVCIANYLYWYLTIECEEGCEDGAATTAEVSQSTSTTTCLRVKDMYSLVLARLRGELRSCSRTHAFLDRQRLFVDHLVRLIKAVHRESGNRQKKIERLQSLLRGVGDNNKAGSEESTTSTNSEFNFLHFSEPLRLPLDPNVMVTGLIPEQATLFKSSLMPARLAFRLADGSGEYSALFKLGDDLRQDQLILQIITLMDRILQQENLDLRLTPYSVLATSSRHGFVQFVDSTPIADILNSDGTILNFFRKHAPSETGPYGIKPEVMDTYVKSCAGYCVITFILGVGDRHLDNLLITKGGNLFHIDFGYILGRDPKVLPPPMKLSREMIEAFGGTASEHYQQFKKECYTAYLSLRRYAHLILNLFSLMVDASVPDIALEPDKTVKKVQEKFKLELNDEAAVGFVESVIDESAAAVMPAIVDRMHKLAQLMRN